VTTLLTVMLLLAPVVGAPSAGYLVIGGLRYRYSNGDFKAVTSAKDAILYSILASLGATVLAGIIWGLGSALVPAWTPAPGMILASTVLAPAPIWIIALAVSFVCTLRGLLVVLRRLIHLAARLQPTAERADYAEVHLAMLHRVLRQRGERWRLWPLLSNILFFSPVVALQRHQSQARLRRAVITARRSAPQ
jgi:hypothetical protein